MIKRENIQNEIENIEKELRNLKVPQGVVKNVDSFYYEHLEPTAIVKIKYGQTENVPITTIREIGSVFVDAVLTRYDKINRIQYIYFNTHLITSSIIIFSTAPIDSVENVE